MIDISYDKLFSVELLHKYSADNACNDFTVIPSAATKQLLGNYRIQVRQIANILNAWINLDPAALESTPSVRKPFIIPEEGLQLTFFMILNNPLFFNYTNLPTANNNGSIYYFTNRNVNKGNNKNFLTGNLKDFATSSYSFEDILANGGSVYQSLKNNNITSSPADLSNINSWRQVLYPDPNNPTSNIADPNRFMSAADVLSWLPSVSRISFAPGQPITPVVTVNVSGYSGSGNYNNNLPAININNSDNHSSFPLDLSGLQQGKYLISVNGFPQKPIYLNDELNRTKVFGVIEIFVESSLAAPYLILNQQVAHKNELNFPLYTIYFLNRATIWKYILRRQSSATITDTGINVFTTITPPAVPTTVIQSDFAIPLSENPLTTLKLDTQSIGPPSATPQRLSKDPNDTSFKPVLYSEIFLNY